jgi:hypothetical protein
VKSTLFSLSVSSISKLSPVGTAESCPGLGRPFSAVPTGLVGLSSNPGLASWAKLSRPSGTEFGNGVLTHGLKAVLFTPFLQDKTLDTTRYTTL